MLRKFLVFGIIFGLITIAGCQSVSHKGLTKAVKSPGNQPREILATNLSFDAVTGEVKYTLPEKALVRLRIGLREGGPLLRTLIDWELRDPGGHTEVWDKKDISGQVEFGTRSDFMLVLACLSVETSLPKENVGDIKGFRKSPDFIIAFPESAEKTDNGVAMIEGAVPISIRVDEKDRKWLTDSKYEVAMFMDQVFLFEDEEGTSPYTFQLNTQGLNDGPHAITVNIIGYEGEIGTKSARIFVKNKK